MYTDDLRNRLRDRLDFDRKRDIRLQDVNMKSSDMDLEALPIKVEYQEEDLPENERSNDKTTVDSEPPISNSIL